MDVVLADKTETIINDNHTQMTAHEQFQEVPSTLQILMGPILIRNLHGKKKKKKNGTNWNCTKKEGEKVLHAVPLLLTLSFL